MGARAPQPWRSGVLAATVIGVGHLISSIAVVILFYVAKSYFDFGDSIWIDWAAGTLLLGLAAWQLRGAFAHGHHHHHHGDESPNSGSAGLWPLAAFAFTLGFAHVLAVCRTQGFVASMVGQ